jgi:hypothetical protein
MPARPYFHAAIPFVVLAACQRSGPDARPNAVTQGTHQSTAIVLTNTHREGTRPWLCNSADTSHHAERNLPPWVQQAFLRDGLTVRYGLFCAVNPFFLSGHLDADTLSDVAVQIIERNSGKRGVAFVQGSDSSVRILGAGIALPNGADDLREIWFWRVESRAALRTEPVQGSELIRLGASPWEWSMVWWDGTTYRWYNPPID